MVLLQAGAKLFFLSKFAESFWGLPPFIIPVGMNRAVREADRSSLSSAEVKNKCRDTSAPHSHPEYGIMVCTGKALPDLYIQRYLEKVLLLFTLENITPTRNISTVLYSNLHNTPIYVFNVDMRTLEKCLYLKL